MTKHLLAALFALLSAPAFGIPMTYGFDGSVGCFGLADCTGPRPVTATFSLDPALDLYPEPDIGRYGVTDLKLTLAGVNLPIIGDFDVWVYNNEGPGPFCGFGPGMQRRDRILFVGITTGTHVSAMFDVCNDGLTSESLVGANLSAFGPWSTGPGDGLVLAGASLLPHLPFPEALGNTRAIYALPPSAPVPEPSTLLLLGAAFGLLALHRSRLRG